MDFDAEYPKINEYLYIAQQYTRYIINRTIDYSNGQYCRHITQIEGANNQFSIIGDMLGVMAATNNFKIFVYNTGFSLDIVVFP